MGIGVSEVGEMNESRAVLHCLCIMNTCFEKCDVFKYT